MIPAAYAARRCPAPVAASRPCWTNGRIAYPLASRVHVPVRHKNTLLHPQAVDDVYRHIKWPDLAKSAKRKNSEASRLPRVSVLLHKEPHRLTSDQVNILLKAFEKAHKDAFKKDWEVSVHLRWAIEREQAIYRNWLALKKIMEQ